MLGSDCELGEDERAGANRETETAGMLFILERRILLSLRCVCGYAVRDYYLGDRRMFILQRSFLSQPTSQTLGSSFYFLFYSVVVFYFLLLKAGTLRL